MQDESQPQEPLDLASSQPEDLPEAAAGDPRAPPEDPAGTFQCCVCYDEHPMQEAFIASMCRHKLCRDAARGVVLAAMGCACRLCMACMRHACSHGTTNPILRAHELPTVALAGRDPDTPSPLLRAGRASSQSSARSARPRPTQPAPSARAGRPPAPAAQGTPGTGAAAWTRT